MNPKTSPSPSGWGLTWWWAHFARARVYYALACSAAIFAISALPNPEGTESIPGLDKVFHLCAYLGLGLSYLNVATVGGRQMTGPRLLLGWAAAVAYGIGDEWHQSFVPGREVEAWDVAADALGAGLAAGVLVLLVRRFPPPARQPAHPQ